MKKRIIPRLGKIRDAESGLLVEGVVTRDPKTLQRLPPTGLVVDRVDAHWLRQERCGGVRIVDEVDSGLMTAEPEGTAAASSPVPSSPNSDRPDDPVVVNGNTRREQQAANAVIRQPATNRPTKE